MQQMLKFCKVIGAGFGIYKAENVELPGIHFSKLQYMFKICRQFLVVESADVLGIDS